jgi:hypothetical protein
MSGITLRLRIDQDGDVFHVVHEDSGKALCSGSWEHVRHWVDPEPRKPSATPAAFLVARKAAG